MKRVTSIAAITMFVAVLGIGSFANSAYADVASECEGINNRTYQGLLSIEERAANKQANADAFQAESDAWITVSETETDPNVIAYALSMAEKYQDKADSNQEKADELNAKLANKIAMYCSRE